MSFFIIAIICTSMMIPGLLLYGYLSFAERKQEYISIMLFSIGGLLTGLTRTITAGIGLLNPDIQAAIMWNRVYETSLVLFFPLIPFFLSQFISDQSSRLLKWHKWLAIAGAVFTVLFIFVIWAVPDAYMIPDPIDQIPHPTRMGRGQYGPINNIAMSLLFAYVLYAMAFSIYSRIKKPGRPYLTTLNLGLLVSLGIIFLEFYELFAGVYPGPVPQYAFSRLLVALTVFSVTAVIAMSQKSSTETREVVRERQIISEKRDELARVAYIDDMTGLQNRQALFRDAAIRFGGNKILMFLDIDNLTFINTFHGYETGDNLIRSVADICRNTVPWYRDLYRVNADIFAVLITGSMYETEKLAVDLLHRVREMKIGSAGDMQHTASVGISRSRDSPDWEDWINRTYTALETAKLNRDRYVIFNPELHEDEKRRHSIIDGMRKSLDESGFTLKYQPIVTADGDPIGAEALVRWVHPELGPVDPEEFIPLAEATGLVSRITLFVVRRCLEDFKDIQRYRKDWRIGINLSGRDLIDQNLPGNLDKIFSEYPGGRKIVGFEVTETELIGNWEQTRLNLNELKKRGFSISLDDFGTGYSSLSYLSILPLDKLKVDRSFIADIPGNEKKVVLLDTIIQLGMDLNLELVIEGIETDEQLAFLKARDCRHFQGFLFSPPMGINEFRAWAAERKKPLI